jgi:hypothetical protein
MTDSTVQHSSSRSTWNWNVVGVSAVSTWNWNISGAASTWNWN